MIVRAIKYLAIIFLFSGCLSNQIEKFDLGKIHSINLSPNKGTYKASIHISGSLDCNTSLEVLHNEKVYHRFNLTPPFIDSTYTIDWYEMDMAFNTAPQECAVGNVNVKITFYQ